MTDIVQKLRLIDPNQVLLMEPPHDTRYAHAGLICHEAAAEIERLREANEALRRDAERWQWVRVWFRREFEGRNGDFGGTLEDFDAAIDAAMGGKP